MPLPQSLRDSADPEKIDGATLALLLLGRHDGARVSKAFDREVMVRLHERGFISNPRTPDKSVVITQEGEQLALAYFRLLFERDAS